MPAFPHTENRGFKTMEEIKTIIKRGGLDNLKRELIINPDFIQFEDTDSKTTSPTRFEKESITEYRYGVEWFSGFYLPVGLQFKVHLRNSENKIIKINFRSFYGYRKKELALLLSNIVDALWEFYFAGVADNFLRKLHDGESIEIGDARISSEGITLKKKGSRKVQENFIPWNDVGTQNYQSYFAIFSKNTPTINGAYYYMSDWNTAILFSIVRAILLHNKLI